MNEATSTSSSRQLDTSASNSTALAPSSAQSRGGQGAGGPPPFPQFNLPHSYWLSDQDRRNLLDREQAYSAKLVDRYLAACSESKSTIAEMFEKMEADRENDPRSRSEGRLQINMMTFQPARFELSADTVGGLTVLNDSEGKLSQSAAETLAAATGTQQDAAASGCCIPPSCTIL